MWIQAPGERIKRGLAYTKVWSSDEKKFIDSSDVRCEGANYIKTSKDAEKNIVRIEPIEQFFLCSTRSSDGTVAKFDFDDPSQCEICQGFNPFADQPIKGEENANDPEPKKDTEDTTKVDDSTTPATTPATTPGFRFKELPRTNNTMRFAKMAQTPATTPATEPEKPEEPKYEMTRQEKLNVLRTQVKDWIAGCDKNVNGKLLEKAEIKWFENKDDAAGFEVDAL